MNGDLISGLETRLNNTFPNCVKGSHEATIQATSRETNQEVVKKTIKAVTIFHPSEHYKHIGFVIPHFGIEYLGIPKFIASFQGQIEFNQVKFKLEDATQHGHVATHDDFVFTKKVYVFTDKVNSELNREEITKFFKDNGFFLEIRDNDYHEHLISEKSPDVFICHDSRDKEFAGKLAFELGFTLVKVWYDAYTLEIGDSLTAKIQDGISKTKFGIIVISKDFLSNERWVKFELQSLMTRQIISEKKIILPIWHGITPDDLKDYPWLLDKVALNSNIGIKGIGVKIKTLVDNYQA